MDDVTRRRRQARFGVLAVGLLVVAVAGYLGFVAFVESGPGVSGGITVLAAATGFAAFFSPCSFPLLLSFLTRKSADSTGAALLSALRVGAGAAVLLSLLAVVMATGGVAVGLVVGFDTALGRVFRVAVGVLLLVLGLRQAELVALPMRWFDRTAVLTGRMLGPQRASNSASGDFAYGFGYLLAGFG